MKRNVKFISAHKVTAVIIAAFLMLSVIPFSFVSAATVIVDTVAEFETAVLNQDNIHLTANITLPSDWTSASYSGTLNGNGHVITTSKTVFGSLTGTVSNVGVVAASSFADDAILADSSSGTISGCFAYGVINTASVNPVGGLIGTMTSGSVSESFSCVDITANSASFVGGLIGEIKGGTISDCYSSGSIYADDGSGYIYNTRQVAGFGNLTGEATVNKTYTSCQLRQTNSRAKPSGVNGLYDNQLSIVCESSDNKGVSTFELLNTTQLSSNFAVTGTAYPTLTCFENDIWGSAAQDIVRVSSAAVSFKDTDASTRMEPTGFAARADYLTRNGAYMNRTNGYELVWSITSPNAKIYDTVPFTYASLPGDQEVSLSSDLLQAKIIFSANVTDTPLQVTSGNAVRSWYLTASDKNPYFAGGNGKNGTPFLISTMQQLEDIRHYGLSGSHYYQLVNDIAVDAYFDPIVDFTGDFNGNEKTLSDITLKDNELDRIGLFATTRSGAAIHDVILHSVLVESTNNEAVMGALIGSAKNTTVSRVMISGSDTLIRGTGVIGGLIGVADSCQVTNALVSTTIECLDNAGGLIGQMNGGKLTQSGTTGYVIGEKNLGGLVGKSTSSAVVSDSYSTMTILSDATGNDVGVGGLIGNNGGSLTTSYVASLADAALAEDGFGPLVGVGNSAGNCFYAGDGYVSVSKKPEHMVGSTFMSVLSPGIWTVTDTNMPQIAVFASKNYSKSLSNLSTTPVYFQKYWNESGPDNMTTGWISNQLSLNEPTPIQKNATMYHDGKLTVYSVKNGWGFEAESASRRTALCFTATDGIGIRTVAAVREEMNTLAYEVVGNAGVNVYVDLGYSSAKNGPYTGSQTMCTIASTNVPQKGSMLYDMPDAQYVRVKVYTEDDYRIDASSLVLSNGVKMTLDTTTGYYVSESPMLLSNDHYNTKLTITLLDNTPPWGVHQQSY